MRCPDCQKFVSNEDGDPEEQGEPTIDGTTVTVEVRRVLVCAECSTELKEATVAIEAEIMPDDPVLVETPCADGEHQWEEDGDPDFENTIRTEGKGRGTRMFYGVSVRGDVKCAKCGLHGSYEGTDDVQASSMDELI